MECPDRGGQQHLFRKANKKNVRACEKFSVTSATTIDVLIRDMLWEELPESYSDSAIVEHKERIYEYVYSMYPAA